MGPSRDVTLVAGAGLATCSGRFSLLAEVMAVEGWILLAALLVAFWIILRGRPRS